MSLAMTVHKLQDITDCHPAWSASLSSLFWVALLIVSAETANAGVINEIVSSVRADPMQNLNIHQTINTNALPVIKGKAQ